MRGERPSQENKTASSRGRNRRRADARPRTGHRNFERCGANVERVTPAGCYLLAYAGAEAVGVVGVETVVDAGLISILMVIEPMRRRGIGAALLAAARKAAHTRGARQLFAIASDSGYLPRFGFAPISMTNSAMPWAIRRRRICRVRPPAKPRGGWPSVSIFPRTESFCADAS